MHRTLRSARPAAVLALTLGAALVLPGAAFAGTTEPTPVTTTSATSSGSTQPTGSTTSPVTTSTTTSSEPTTTTSTTGASSTSATTTAPSTTGTTTGTTSSPTVGLVPGGEAGRYGRRAAAALPETSTDPTLVAAGFLERELAATGHHLENYGFPDYGLTLDTVLALDAAGAGQTEATAATQYVADHVREYIGPAWGPNELYAGATAKTLLAAVAQGVDPTAFGGVNLVASLESREQPDGRFTDRSDFGTPTNPTGDYSNLIGQSLAVMALHRAGQGPSAAASNIIRANQCADGGFSLSFGATPCGSDPDVTAFAVQALLAVGGVADADAQQGLDYLAGRQGADGGVGGSGPTATANANSTGLAGQAFLAGGRAAQARAAQTYLRGLQHGCDAPVALRGAIAYDAVAKAAATTVTDQDRRGTAQAILALAGTPLFAVSATGADANAPDLACAASPTTTTTTTTGSTSSTSPTSTTSTGGASSTSSTPAAAPVASATPGNLAVTGSNVAAVVLLALVLLAAGAAAIVLARRKGAHA